MESRKTPHLPVLLYHHIAPDPIGIAPTLSISSRTFERHLRWLADLGFKGISARDWSDFREARKPLPSNPILITFDDAYRDTADFAFPLLRRYDFPATVFLLSRCIGGVNAWDAKLGYGAKELMSEIQVREWMASGIEFGSHGRTHCDLTLLDDADLEREIHGSADELNDLLGLSVRSFAYPYGRYNKSVVEKVRRSFDLAFTTDAGVNSPDSDPYCLKRISVRSRDSHFTFRMRLAFGWSLAERAKALARGAIQSGSGKHP
jgi:peptidoglycan/xylan/chitin deacetylase (PgdA/CDA1 family)